ncbi:MAG: DNA-processing protein DprA [candidate division WOR-3 bacterium]|nr:DNA-processing protein DprA [candidate division WOR-3 bacterium]
MAKTVESIVSGQIDLYNMDSGMIDKSLEWIKSHNIGITDSHLERGSISSLRIPQHLFFAGNEDLLNKKKIAIVGTRKPDNYGHYAVEKIVSSLSSEYATVSGFALGIDSLVHSESIKNNIATIAVTGSGFAVNYPASNAQLKRRIIEEGLLLSEYSPFIKPYRHNFIKRNLIIAYLADIVIITRGTSRSGTLSTLTWAEKLDREIYALPGNINSKLSYAPNYALSRGARPLHDLSECSFLKADNKTGESVSPSERKILKIISRYPRIDTMLRNSEYSRENLLSIITNLEIKNIVRRTANNTIEIMEDINGRTDTED